MVRSITVLVAVISVVGTAPSIVAQGDATMPLCTAPAVASTTEQPGWCPLPDGTVPGAVVGTDRGRLTVERRDARPLHCPYPAEPGTAGRFIPGEVTAIGTFGGFTPDPAGDSRYCINVFPAKDIRITYECLQQFDAEGTTDGPTVVPGNDSFAERFRAWYLEQQAVLTGVPWIGGVFDWSAVCGLVEPLGTRYGFTPLEFINAFRDVADACDGGDAGACEVLCPPCGSDWSCMGMVAFSSGETVEVRGARSVTLADLPKTLAEADRLRAVDAASEATLDLNATIGAANCHALGEIVPALINAMPINQRLACSTDLPDASLCDHWAFPWALYELAFQPDYPDDLNGLAEIGGKLIALSGKHAKVTYQLGEWDIEPITRRVFEYRTIGGVQVPIGPPVEKTGTIVTLYRDSGKIDWARKMSALQVGLELGKHVRAIVFSEEGLHRLDLLADAFDELGYASCAAKARDLLVRTQGALEGIAYDVTKPVAQGLVGGLLFKALAIEGVIAVPLAPVAIVGWIGLDGLDIGVTGARVLQIEAVAKVARAAAIEETLGWSTARCEDPLDCASAERAAMLLQSATYGDYVIARGMAGLYGKWFLSAGACIEEAVANNWWLRWLWTINDLAGHPPDPNACSEYQEAQMQWEAKRDTALSDLRVIPLPHLLPPNVVEHIEAAIADRRLP